MAMPNPQDETMRQVEEVRLELKSAHAERMLLTVQVAQLTAERNRLQDEVTRLEQVVRAAPSHADIAALQDQLTISHSNYEDERATRIALQQSRSWRITAPLRKLLGKA